MNFSSKLAFTLLIFGLVSSGCHFAPTLGPPGENYYPFHMPTKDDVAIVDGQPLTLTDVTLLRRRLSSGSSAHAVWAGMSILALNSHRQKSGMEVKFLAAFDIARYALEEIRSEELSTSTREFIKTRFPASVNGATPSSNEIKYQLNSLISHSEVKQNQFLLSQIDLLTR